MQRSTFAYPLQGHLFLAGDAFCTFRPHVASSTNQAALHALLLRRTLTSGTLQLRPHVTHPRFSSKTNQIAMQAYEAQVRQYAKLTGLTSVAWGNKLQCSMWVFLGSVFWLALAYVEVSVERLWDWLTFQGC